MRPLIITDMSEKPRWYDPPDYSSRITTRLEPELVDLASAELEDEKKLEKRHIMAAAGVRFEDYLFNHRDRFESFGDSYANVVADFYEFAELTEVSPRLEKILLGVYEWYQGAYHAAHEDNLELRKYLFKDSEPENADPYEYGKRLFFARTGVEPKYPVHFSHELGYFILYCQGEDYTKFRREEPGKKSGGCLYFTFPIEELPSEVPLVVIDGSHEENFSPTLITVKRHERQHFINRTLLKNFDVLENDAVVSMLKTNSPDVVETDYVNAYKDLKDEILAYLKDGRKGSEIVSNLESPLYEHLLSVFPEKDRNSLIKILEEIGAEIDNADDIFNRLPFRGLLVYHLIDRPLPTIPDYITTIARWYREQLKDWPILTDNDTEEIGITEATQYPSAYQDAFSNVKKKYSAVVTADDIRIMSGSKSKRAHTSLAEAQKGFVEYEKAREALYVKGVHVPYFRITDIGFVSEEHRGKVYDVAQNIGTNLVDTILEQNQEFIDQLYINYQISRKKIKKKTDQQVLLSREPLYDLVADCLNDDGARFYEGFILKGKDRDPSLRLKISFSIPLNYKKVIITEEIIVFPSPEVVNRVRQDILGSNKLDV